MNEQLLLVEDDDAIDNAMRMHLAKAGHRLHGDDHLRRAALQFDAARRDAAGC